MPGALKVLIIDDDPVVRRALDRELSGVGLSVSGAADAASALALLSTTTFDGLVVDQDMPEMTGIELVSRLRRSGYGGAVVMFTGDDRTETHAAAIAVGVDSLVGKGRGIAELALVVLDLIGRRSGRERDTDRPPAFRSNPAPVADRGSAPELLGASEVEQRLAATLSGGAWISAAVLLTAGWPTERPGRAVLLSVLSELQQRLPSGDRIEVRAGAYRWVKAEERARGGQRE